MASYTVAGSKWERPTVPEGSLPFRMQLNLIILELKVCLLFGLTVRLVCFKVNL